MKKIIIFLSIIMVVLAAGSRNVYAGKENFSLYGKNAAVIKEEPVPAVSLDEETTDNRTVTPGLYDNSELRAAGDRPGNGDGIGQEGGVVPPGDGLWVILLGCFLLIVLKVKSRSRW
jgi:hypothetical protein